MGEFVNLRCDRHLEQTAAMVPPSVVVKDGFERCRREDLRIRHGQAKPVLMKAGRGEEWQRLVSLSWMLTRC